MSIDSTSLKKDYVIAKCCNPRPPNDPIIGHLNFKQVIVVHKTGCQHLKKVEPERLVKLSWNDITEQKDEGVGKDYSKLDKLDFRILKHHKTMGIDYSLMVAKILRIKPDQAFEHHRKLRSLKLLERVSKVMVQYRKNIVDNKWIKHRNHTYYRITPKGERYLNFFLEGVKKSSVVK
jgi:hypothetical protein